MAYAHDCTRDQAVIIVSSRSGIATTIRDMNFEIIYLRLVRQRPLNLYQDSLRRS